jgi:hypothetical protein
MLKSILTLQTNRTTLSKMHKNRPIITNALIQLEVLTRAKRLSIYDYSKGYQSAEYEVPDVKEDEENSCEERNTECGSAKSMF